MSNIKTFDEWKKEGRYIAKGQKACGHNDRGEPLFMGIQLQPRRRSVNLDSFNWLGEYTTPYGDLSTDDAIDMCNPNEGCK